MFATIGLALLLGHLFADYFVQTDHQATHKHLPGAPGRRPCVRHVVGITATQAVFVAAAAATASLYSQAPVHADSICLGLALNAATHYWADRRTTFAGLVVATDRFSGKATFYATPTGAHMLDQAFHGFWVFVAAVVAALPLAGATPVAAAGFGVLAACEAASRRHR